MQRVTSQALARVGVEAAPILIVIDPSGVVRYAGGYTERKQGPVVADIRILRATERGDAPVALPIFGCAVSERLRGELSTLPYATGSL